MSVLVTGGTGLIGSQVVADLAAAGDAVVVMARNLPTANDARAGLSVEYAIGDIRDAARVNDVMVQCKVDRVIHLAALLQVECEDDPDTAVTVNVDGTLNLLRAARDAGVRRFVFGSSIAVYGSGTCVFAEDTLPVTPVRLYGQTKRMGEYLGERYQALHGMEFVAMRYGGVFGPGGPVRRRGMSALRHALKQTMDGRSVRLDGASGGECFQYTYAKDAAAATILGLTHPAPPSPVYNVAGPLENYISLRAFHAAIREVAPEAGDAEFTGKSESGLRVSIQRLAEELGFVPKYSVVDGLRDELARSA